MRRTDDGQPTPATMGPEKELARVMEKFKRAKSRWSSWSDIWEEAYDYVMPHRESFYQESSRSKKDSKHI